MTLDLEKFSAEARKQQIRLGRPFNTEQVLKQANQTLTAYVRYGVEMEWHGFADVDARRLEAARDMLIAAGVGRVSAAGEKQVMSKGADEALSHGQDVRLQARTILQGVVEDLEDSVGAGVIEARRRITTVMRSTALAAGTREGLAVQLDLLARVYMDEAVAGFAAVRRGPEVVERLEAAAAGLRVAERRRAGVRGTPEETQRLNQIDGIIVRLVRRARKAALSAARATGNPALANAFKLTHLYRTRKSAGSGTAEDAGRAAESTRAQAEGADNGAQQAGMSEAGAGEERVAAG